MGEKLQMRPAPGAQADPADSGAFTSAPPAPNTPLTAMDFGMGLGSIDSVRKEIDDVFSDMREFHNTEPDEVMRYCAGHRARLAEIRVLIQRIEVIHRQWRPVRTNEIEPVLEELKEQFSIASRIISVRELDWRMEGAGT